DGMAVPFPVGEAAGERDDVLVAHLLERLRGEGRAVADRAIEDDRLTRVRGGALDARLEVAARDVHSPWDVALVPLVLLADIDDERLASFDQLAGACGVDLGDLGAHLLQQFPVRRHRFPKYSERNLDTVELWMSPRLRVWSVVGAAALAAAAVAVGVTLATRSDVHHSTSKPPPFLADPTAPPKVASDVRQALKAWPAGTVRRLRILAERYPHSALVRLELGVALAFAGSETDASRAWHESRQVQPDSPSAVRAGDL